MTTILSKTLLLATSASILATANPSFAQNLKAQEIRDKLDQKLAAQEKGSASGMNIRSVKASELQAATKNLNGRVTVEFSRTDKVSYLQKGGVIIGSPSDGLDDIPATSTQSLGGDITLNPPIDPDQSIKVFGGSGTYCICKIETDDTGEIIKGRTSFLDKNLKCESVGKAIPVLKPGLYLVLKGLNNPQTTESVGNTSYSNSLYLTTIEPKEKKVIPLRKVNIPDSPGNRVEHSLQIDLSAPSEIEKLATIYWTDSNGLGSSVKGNFEEFLKSFQVITSKESYSQNLYFSDPNKSDNLLNGNFANLQLNTFEHTYYVLPGVYYAAWKVNGAERKPTIGIHVQ